MVEITAEQAAQVIRTNEARIGQIQRQMQEVTRTLEAIAMTRATLEEMPDSDAEGLVPVGGVFLPVKANVSNVQVDIGSGVAVEKTRKQAVDTLKKREEVLQKTMVRLQEAGNRLGAEAMELRKKLAERMKQSDVPVISG